MAVSIKSSLVDIEKNASIDKSFFSNSSVDSFSWSNIAVTVKDRRTKQPLNILSNVNGVVKAGEFTSRSLSIYELTFFSGELLALMGPRYDTLQTSIFVLIIAVVLVKRHSSTYLRIVQRPSVLQSKGKRT